MLTICVLHSGRGCAQLPASSSSSYQYVDLWSRRSTWGGNTPPVEGDAVFIPAGTTVVLDVSPPRLSLLVVEGNLMLDPDVGADIHLQVWNAFNTYLTQTAYGAVHLCVTL